MMAASDFALQGGYYEAMATDVDLERKVIQCQYPKAVEGSGREHSFELPYDVLVVGVRCWNPPPPPPYGGLRALLLLLPS